MISSSNTQSYYMGYVCRPLSAKQNCRKSFSNIHQNQHQIFSQQFQLKNIQFSNHNYTHSNINNEENFQFKLQSEVNGQHQNKKIQEILQKQKLKQNQIQKLTSSNNFQPYPKSQRQKIQSYNAKNIKRPMSSNLNRYTSSLSQNSKPAKVCSRTQDLKIRLNSQNIVSNRQKTNQQRKKMYDSYAVRKGSQKSKSFFRNVSSAKQKSQNKVQDQNLNKSQQIKNKVNSQVQKLNLLLNRNSEDLPSPQKHKKQIISYNIEQLKQSQNVQPIFNHFPNTYNVIQQLYSKKNTNPRQYYHQKNRQKSQNLAKQDISHLNYSYSMVVEEFIKPKIIKIIENQQHRQRYTKNLIQRAIALTTKKIPIHNRMNKQQNRVKFAKYNKPKKGLSIGAYRNLSNSRHQIQILQKDVNMIVTSARCKTSKNQLIGDQEIDQSRLIQLLKEKRTKQNEKTQIITNKRTVYKNPGTLKLNNNNQQDPKPWEYNIN